MPPTDRPTSLFSGTIASTAICQLRAFLDGNRSQAYARRALCAGGGRNIFGLEMDDDHHFSAEAITDSTILVVKRSALVALANVDCDVAGRLWTFTARELQRVRDHMLLLTRTAQERVVAFLLDMAERRAAAEEIDVPMSRQDIADYLGLTIETISRTLTQLETQEAIALPTSRRIVLCNRRALTRFNA